MKCSPSRARSDARVGARPRAGPPLPRRSRTLRAAARRLLVLRRSASDTRRRDHRRRAVLPADDAEPDRRRRPRPAQQYERQSYREFFDHPRRALEAVDPERGRRAAQPARAGPVGLPRAGVRHWRTGGDAGADDAAHGRDVRARLRPRGVRDEGAAVELARDRRRRAERERVRLLDGDLPGGTGGVLPRPRAARRAAAAARRATRASRSRC